MGRYEYPQCNLVDWSGQFKTAVVLKHMQVTVDFMFEGTCKGFTSTSLKLVAFRARKALWKEEKLVDKVVIVQDLVRDDISCSGPSLR